MQTDLRIGTEIAGHRVLSVLGRGPRSVVYLAAQGSSSEKAALKVLAPEVGSDRAFRERFVRESRAAAALDHPNVIPIHEVGEADGVVYLTMRYVEGEDLGRLVDWWGIAPEHAVAVLSQVASALDAAHAAGLVHGNVRPANILVARAEGASWHAYLTDFGLGAAAGANLPADYVAPEQSQTEGVDGRADVYALGRVARFCLEVGRSPTRDSPEIDAVIARATAERPQNRYATAGELVGALREAITAPAARFPGAEQPPAARERRPVQPGALIGRERELGELLEGLRGAVAGRGRLFLVAGEPGVGKSRLADELASRARAQGVRVLWGRCWEAGGAPAYWPWVQLLRSCLRGQDPATVREQMGEGAMDVAQMLPEVRALIPELPPPPSVDPESARFRLFDSTAAFLRNASGEGPWLWSSRTSTRPTPHRSCSCGSWPGRSRTATSWSWPPTGTSSSPPTIR
ncbi:MAG: serine/threonine-protein kinase [Actinomycetota bacterium]|nr:serine/threonine-protein kinase [Actinomycetota bacterium]